MVTQAIPIATETFVGGRFADTNKTPYVPCVLAYHYNQKSFFIHSSLDSFVLKERAASTDRSASTFSWIEPGIRSLAHVLGDWPYEKVQIQISLSNRSKGAIPWAFVTRQPIPQIHFQINPQANSTKLSKDWTLYHELSHLLIPYKAPEDIWFSEGLASYYQNILQYFSEKITEREAWQKMYEGFQRGRAFNKQPHASLEEIAKNMWRNKHYYRVYWSGAWYFLAVDIELRKANPEQGLHQILQAFNQCCASDNTLMLAKELINHFDRLSNSHHFSEMANTVKASNTVPDAKPLFNVLGIELDHNNVRLAKNSVIRSKIMHPTEIGPITPSSCPATTGDLDD